MPDTPQNTAWWRGVTFALWLAFFAIGLVPELVYSGLREAGNVPTQRALVNSPLALTVALSIYLALFVYRRCSESGMPPAAAQLRSFQVGVLGLAAFLGMPHRGATAETVSLVQALIAYRLVPDPASRAALLIAGITKVGLWWYLLTLTMRYYVFDDPGVFARMTSFWSARGAVATSPADSEPPQDPVEQKDGAISP